MGQPHKVIISGGGTGGHIFPAIAIAHALKRRSPGIEILFIGALGRMEMEKVPVAGFPVEGLPIAGLQRSFSVSNLSLPFKVISSLMKASSIISRFRPSAVVGVGGYASGPVLFSASMKGIPTLIQEQNSYAGITNRILGRRANRICVSYEGMEQFFPKHKLVLTGNPVRRDILGIRHKRKEALDHFGLMDFRKTILVIGGSLGARTINESVLAHLGELTEGVVQVLWQTGNRYFDAIVNADAVKQLKDQVKVLKFIDRMDLAYAAADIVISRAGALSIAELCIAEKPAVLVPSPNVAEDHQTKNAMALVKKEAALMVQDGAASVDLTKVALQLLHDEALQQKLSVNIAALARPFADEAIADEVLALMN